MLLDGTATYRRYRLEEENSGVERIKEGSRLSLDIAGRMQHARRERTIDPHGLLATRYPVTAKHISIYN
jgi:hypothetical protein